MTLDSREVCEYLNSDGQAIPHQYRTKYFQGKIVSIGSRSSVEWERKRLILSRTHSDRRGKRM